MPYAQSLPRTVFIVDDDETIARSLTRLLNGFGYVVVGAARDADAALAAIPELQPGLAIIDIDLHGRSGIELAADILRLHDLPIVFLTAVNDPEIQPLASTTGVFAFLAKPCTATVLRTTVHLVRMQHEARTKLQHLERHYHALFEQAAVGVAEIEVESGRMLDVNRKCAQIFASTVTGLRGRQLAERITNAEQRTEFLAALARLGRDAHEHVVELWCVRDDGQRVCVRLTAAPLAPEAPSARHVLIVEDVTDRRRVETQLERERKLLAESQRNAEIGSFHFDFTTREIIWSEEMYRLHGVEAASFTPTETAILPLVAAADQPRVAAAMQPPASANAFQSSMSYTVRLPDGTDRRLFGRGALVHDAKGNIEAVIGTVQNVTERDESEARERMAIEASRAKTDFLAHMSHELRTPLNAVLGLSEALLERTFGELRDAQANALATIHSSGRHLLDLINDVLDIARVESGKLPIEPDVVALRALFDESIDLIHAQLTIKGQRLVIDLAPALPPVDVDRRRIKQVLLNLLGNASKFSPPGARVTLRASVLDGGREVEIVVADDGPGIDPANRERIFEPFVTLDPSISRAHDGAGLGLALAKRIVELHGGRIRVDSVLGQGAAFTITLPCAASYAGEPPVPVAIEPSLPSQREHRATVLLAEDNEPTVLTVASYLESRGYDVVVVRDGKTASEAALAPEISAVLMDLQLPVMDGLQATRHIRSRPEGTTKPIVALTAHAMPGDDVRCFEAGATLYMAKPVRLRQLAAALDRLLEDRT